MLRRAFWLLGLLLIFIVARPPAGLMDALIDRASGGRMRLALPEGSFWHGRGLLASSDGQRTLRAWRPVEWRVRPSLATASLRLEFGEHGHTQLAVTLAATGMRLDTLALDLPIGAITAGMAHTVAKAGWRGSLDLGSPGLVCGWDGVCEGSLRARWLSAGLDIIPERPLGDHEITLRAYGQTFEVGVATLAGELRIDGSGRIDAQRRFNFTGFVEGPPELVDRMPNVMERNATLTDQPGRVRISLP